MFVARSSFIGTSCYSGAAPGLCTVSALGRRCGEPLPFGTQDKWSADRASGLACFASHSAADRPVPRLAAEYAVRRPEYRAVMSKSYRATNIREGPSRATYFPHWLPARPAGSVPPATIYKLKHFGMEGRTDKPKKREQQDAGRCFIPKRSTATLDRMVECLLSVTLQSIECCAVLPGRHVNGCGRPLRVRRDTTSRGPYR